MKSETGPLELAPGEEALLRWTAIAAATPGLSVAPRAMPLWGQAGRPGPFDSVRASMEGAWVDFAAPAYVVLSLSAGGAWVRDRRLAMCLGGAEPQRRVKSWVAAGRDDKWRWVSGPGRVVVACAAARLVEAPMASLLNLRLDCLMAVSGGAEIEPGAGSGGWIQARGPALLVLGEPAAPRRKEDRR